MQIKVTDTRMHKVYGTEYVPSIGNLSGYREVPVAEAELVLVECKREEALLFQYSGNGSLVIYHHTHGLVKGMGKYIKPILISKTEKMEEGDLVYTIEGDIISWIDKGNETTSDRKILALPEHFSPKHLQAIVDGKMKEGDKVLVECDTLESLPPQYCISLNSSNHITLHKKEQEWIDCHLCIAKHNKNKGKIVLKKGSFVLCNDCPGNLNPLDMKVIKEGFEEFKPIEYSFKEEKMYSREEVKLILLQYQKDYGTKHDKFSELLQKQAIEWFENNVK